MCILCGDLDSLLVSNPLGAWGGGGWGGSRSAEKVTALFRFQYLSKCLFPYSFLWEGFLFCLFLLISLLILLVLHFHCSGGPRMGHTNHGTMGKHTKSWSQIFPAPTDCDLKQVKWSLKLRFSHLQNGDHASIIKSQWEQKAWRGARLSKKLFSLLSF